MTRSTALILILGLGTSLISCRSPKENMKETSDAQRTMPAQPGPGVPPSHCRINGTIVAIDQQRTGNPNDACSKAPCLATVKVDEVLGYGSGFTDVLGKGKELKVKFEYTLAPTADLFPQMAPPLPGLEVGAKFQTDLLMLGPSLSGSNESGYIVKQYQRK
jgi:hypothetical protein